MNTLQVPLSGLGPTSAKSTRDMLTARAMRHAGKRRQRAAVRPFIGFEAYRPPSVDHMPDR
jgi:hypothetical protein